MLYISCPSALWILLLLGCKGSLDAWQSNCTQVGRKVLHLKQHGMFWQQGSGTKISRLRPESRPNDMRRTLTLPNNEINCIAVVGPCQLDTDIATQPQTLCPPPWYAVILPILREYCDCKLSGKRHSYCCTLLFHALSDTNITGAQLGKPV